MAPQPAGDFPQIHRTIRTQNDPLRTLYRNADHKSRDVKTCNQILKPGANPPYKNATNFFRIGAVLFSRNTHVTAAQEIMNILSIRTTGTLNTHPNCTLQTDNAPPHHPVKPADFNKKPALFSFCLNQWSDCDDQRN